ncbi:YfhO family protein [Candidatus Daviesbacteria bacterium]|nr:YfhO family protein [Candidatus Daviesbacteria bacterium]
MKFKKFYPLIFSDKLLLFVLVIIVLIFLWKGVTMQGVFFGADEIASDLLHHAYPYKDFFANNYLRQGKIPLWNPYIGSGTPILGEAQTAPFFFLSDLLYLKLPSALAFNYLVISNFIILSLGVYFFARKIKISPLGAFFASMVFTLSGTMVGHLRHVPLLNALIVFPYILILIEEIISKAKFVWVAVLSLLIFVSFSSGQLTATYLLLFVCFCYFLIRIWLEFKESGKESFKPIGMFILALIIGVCLSAVILLPALEMISYSTRGNLSLASALSPAFKIKYLALFLSPFAFGDPSKGSWDINSENYWENIGYIGILPLFLSLIGLYIGIKAKDKYTQCFGLLLLFCLLLVLGDSLWVYKLIHDFVPGFSFTRIPGRFLFYIDFFLSILAGRGLIYLFSYFKTRKTLIILVIVFLSLYDLFYFGRDFNNVMPLSYFQEPNTVKFFKSDHDLYRVRSIGSEPAWQEAWRQSAGWRGDLSAYLEQRELLPSDYNLVYKIASPAFIYGLGGHFGIKRSSELDRFVADNYLDQATNSAKLFGLENVKYVFSFQSNDQNKSFSLATKIQASFGQQTVYIYQNKDFLPRAYLVGQSRYLPDNQAIFRFFNSLEFDPSKEVILEDKIAKPNSSGKGSVQINHYDNDNVLISAFSQDGGFLVLSDTYYPGWKAYVDGKEKN